MSRVIIDLVIKSLKRLVLGCFILFFHSLYNLWYTLWCRSIVLSIVSIDFVSKYFIMIGNYSWWVTMKEKIK